MIEAKNSLTQEQQAQIDGLKKKMLEENEKITDSEQYGKAGDMVLMTISEAVHVYKFSRWTWHRLRKQRKIRAYKKERKVLLDVRSIEAYIRNLEEKTYVC